MKYIAYLFLFICSTPLATLTATPKYEDFLGKDCRELQLCSLGASFMVTLQIALDGKGAFSDLPDVSDLSYGFVERIAEYHNISDKLQIKISDGYAAGINTILIPYDAYASLANEQLMSEIDALVKECDISNPESVQKTSEQLYEHIGALDHEFTHYKNKDLRNYLIVSSLVNIAIYTSYLCLENKFLADKLRTSGQIKKFLYAFASGIGLTACTSTINSWIARMQEKRADEGVRNEAHILKAMIRRYTRAQEEIKEFYRNSESWFKRKQASWFEKYPMSYLLMDPIHPPLPDRVARFQQRLDALEAANAVAL